MSDAGWKAVLRLGVPTFFCASCKVVEPLRLSRGENETLASQHWRVEKHRQDSKRSWREESLVSSWLVCSKECGRVLVAKKIKEHGTSLPTAVYRACGPSEPSEP